MRAWIITIVVAIVVAAAAFYAGLQQSPTKTVTVTSVTTSIVERTRTVTSYTPLVKTIVATTTKTLTETIVKRVELAPIQIELEKALSKVIHRLSPQSRSCVQCHAIYTPGIVADWLRSRHAMVTPEEAWSKPQLQREISGLPPEPMRRHVVGCFECHGLNPDAHPDTFEHFGFRIHTIVTPRDCEVCHPVEVREYERSVKAWAHENLVKNPVYMLLVNATNQVDMFGIKAGFARAVESSCFACHGTEVKLVGFKTITIVGPKGEKLTVKVPVYTGWPNHGVGRVNPDGSRGSCSACHPRHSFSIAIARSPYTCAQCHLDPDVPGFDVWKESKHGNIFLAEWKTYNMTAVPWVPGRDFRAPSCAVCHFSLLTDENGRVIAPRTHDPGSRIWLRIFGVYAHPQPKPEYQATFRIRNDVGLPLPYDLVTGKPASKYLIDAKEMEARREQMVRICSQCHSESYAWQRIRWFEEVVNETNKAVKAATLLLARAWQLGMAKGLKIVDGRLVVEGNPFDEYIERRWIEVWLFYAHSIRYGAAMNGPDWTTFKRGWYQLTRAIEEIKTLIELYEASHTG